MKFGEKGRTISLGIIGFGARGYGQVETLLAMPDVEIAAICDLYEDRIGYGLELVKRIRGSSCLGTTDYRAVNRMAGLDAVVIMTDWASHIKIALDALENGKSVGLEVGPASSLDECWSLVKTTEKSGLICMLLENGCYDSQQLAMLNMVRQGIFGELVFCSGGYQHDLREEIGYGDIKRHYRQPHFLYRNGELYPTHEIGPLAKLLRINRGNRLVSLTAMSSKAVGLSQWFLQHRPDRPDLIHHKVAQGDIAIVLIRCANGELIQLTHDCTLPRPFAQDFRVQGTKGLWMEAGDKIHIEGITKEHEWDNAQEWMQRFKHPLWQAYEKFGPRGDHDGLDYLTLRAFVDAVQHDVQPPIDVYDAASWMAITCLSEQSIALGSETLPIPDFTNGSWLTRQPGPPTWHSLDEVYHEEFEDLA